MGAMHLKNNIIAMSMLILLALMPVIPAVLAATISITTDKSSYAVGDALVVSGTATPVEVGQDVSIIIYGPSGDIRALDQATPAADGTFSKTVMVFSDTDVSGTWSTKATYKGISNTASFSVSGTAPPTHRTQITLTLDVDVGEIYIKGDSAEVYVLASYKSTPIDANLTATIYGASVLKPSTTKVTTGVYKIAVPIPTNATTGTYSLVVKANHVSDQYEGTGLAMKSFLVSSNLDLTSVKSDIATIKTGVTDAKTAATSAKSAVDGMSTTLTIAVVLALIAAAASVFSVVQVSRKK